ncbi:MAG TPA: TasA family protein [Symbiobacteriaceae bacterium]|nr:TasA family protein [Symbiobacteriaceae bacterium]
MMKRLYLGLLAIAAIAVLTTVGSLALFSASATPETATYTAGTVTLGDPTTRLATVTGLAPGDTGSSTYTIQYTGNLSAWLGLDTSLSGDLTTCDGGGRLTVTITDANSNSYSSNASNQVIKGAAGAIAPVAAGATKAFTVSYNLALAAGNACQGKSATISLTVKAVQSANNTDPGVGPLSWN